MMSKKSIKNFENDRSFQTIKQLAKSINDLAGQAVAEYSQDVDAIIVSQSRDRNRIEHALDGMLDFCFDNNMLKMYKRLCRYYYEIDPAETAEYVYAYRNMWDQPQGQKAPKRRKNNG